MQSASDGQHFTFSWPVGHFVPPGQQARKDDHVPPQSCSVATQEPFLRTESPNGLLNISDIGSVTCNFRNLTGSIKTIEGIEKPERVQGPETTGG